MAVIEEWDEAQDFQDCSQFRIEAGDTAALLAMTVSFAQMGVWAPARSLRRKPGAGPLRLPIDSIYFNMQ